MTMNAPVVPVALWMPNGNRLPVNSCAPEPKLPDAVKLEPFTEPVESVTSVSHVSEVSSLSYMQVDDETAVLVQFIPTTLHPAPDIKQEDEDADDTDSTREIEINIKENIDMLPDDQSDRPVKYGQNTAGAPVAVGELNVTLGDNLVTKTSLITEDASTKEAAIPNVGTVCSDLDVMKKDYLNVLGNTIKSTDNTHLQSDHNYSLMSVISDTHTTRDERYIDSIGSFRNIEVSWNSVESENIKQPVMKAKDTFIKKHEDVLNDCKTSSDNINDEAASEVNILKSDLCLKESSCVEGTSNTTANVSNAEEELLHKEVNDNPSFVCENRYVNKDFRTSKGLGEVVQYNCKESLDNCNSLNCELSGTKADDRHCFPRRSRTLNNNSYMKQTAGFPIPAVVVIKKPVGLFKNNVTSMCKPLTKEQIAKKTFEEYIRSALATASKIVKSSNVKAQNIPFTLKEKKDGKDTSTSAVGKQIVVFGKHGTGQMKKSVFLENGLKPDRSQSNFLNKTESVATVGVSHSNDSSAKTSFRSQTVVEMKDSAHSVTSGPEANCLQQDQNLSTCRDYNSAKIIRLVPVVSNTAKSNSKSPVKLFRILPRVEEAEDTISGSKNTESDEILNTVKSNPKSNTKLLRILPKVEVTKDTTSGSEKTESDEILNTVKSNPKSNIKQFRIILPQKELTIITSSDRNKTDELSETKDKLVKPLKPYQITGQTAESSNVAPSKITPKTLSVTCSSSASALFSKTGTTNSLSVSYRQILPKDSTPGINAMVSQIITTPPIDTSATNCQPSRWRRRPGYEHMNMPLYDPDTEVSGETTVENNAMTEAKSESDDDSDIEIFEVGHTVNGECIKPSNTLYGFDLYNGLDQHVQPVKSGGGILARAISQSYTKRKNPKTKTDGTSNHECEKNKKRRLKKENTKKYTELKSCHVSLNDIKGIMESGIVWEEDLNVCSVVCQQKHQNLNSNVHNNVNTITMS